MRSVPVINSYTQCKMSLAYDSVTRSCSRPTCKRAYKVTRLVFLFFQRSTAKSLHRFNTSNDVASRKTAPFGMPWKRNFTLCANLLENANKTSGTFFDGTKLSAQKALQNFHGIFPVSRHLTGWLQPWIARRTSRIPIENPRSSVVHHTRSHLVAMGTPRGFYGIHLVIITP